MKDFFAAVEELTTLLSLRIENVNRKRGWPMKRQGQRVLVAPGRTIQLTSSQVYLPRGECASLVPRPQPQPDGKSWLIDVRRSDGVQRRSFAEGVVIGPAGKAFTLYLRGSALSDEMIDEMMEDMAKPGPSGVSLWIRRVWGLRFGKMSLEVSGRLEQVRDVEELDRLHAAVLRAVDQAEAEAAVLGPPAAAR